MKIDRINAFSVEAFVDRFGFLFEHSAWIVAAAAARRPFADIAAMEQAMADVIAGAGPEAQRALIRAHPDLAGKAAIDGTLTEASAAEQASAGLDRLSADEHARFTTLNDAYRARFGMPFIICVRLSDKAGILRAMENRLANDEETEIATGLAEIAKIVHLRLTDALGGDMA